MADVRACVDRIPQPRTPGERMAVLNGVKWNPGDIIRVSFLDGSASLRDRVASAASEWMQFARIAFAFGDRADAQVRISFSADPGSWSTLGRDCLNVPAGEPTMNYGWLTEDTDDVEVRRVVLHEFGHALGALHEHQNPAGGIHWNTAAVYAYYAGPPNNWSKADVDRNLFATYQKDLTSHTDVDPTSIMMYPIPAAFTTDGFSAGFNTELSDMDKVFIRQVYP